LELRIAEIRANRACDHCFGRGGSSANQLRSTLEIFLYDWWPIGGDGAFTAGLHSTSSWQAERWS
jgi:hypothetical protein